MFGSLGFPEMAFIVVLALLIFGPKRLPELGRTLGRGLSEFRKASNELKRSINVELALEEDPPSHHPQMTRREVMGDPPRPAIPAPYEPPVPSRITDLPEDGVAMEAAASGLDRLEPIQPVPDPRAEPRSETGAA